MAQHVPFNTEYDLIIPMVVSVLLATSGIYFDEGHYSFNALLDPVNLIFYFVYTGLFFGVQLLTQMGLRYLIANKGISNFALSSTAVLVLLGGIYLIFR